MKGFSITEERAQWMRIRDELCLRSFYADSLIGFDHDEPDPEPEVVEKTVRGYRRIAISSTNRKMMLDTRVDPLTGNAINTYFSQAQSCHSGVDSRRKRHGRIIGHNHRRRSHDLAEKRPMPVPVAVVIDDRRMSIG